ncbi:hypothetical protein D3C78_642370 [compost metagenome]
MDGDPHQRIFMQHVDQRGLGVDQLAALHAAGHVQHHGQVHLRRRLWHQAARRVVVGGRAVVAEDQLAAEVQRDGVLVAVAIGDGADQADLAGADAECVVRISAIGMLQGDLLVQLQFASGGIQREAEGRRPAGSAHAPLDHRRTDLVQHDRLAGRGGQAAARAVAHRQAVAGTAAVGTGGDVERPGEMAGGVVVQVAFVHRQAFMEARLEGDARTVVEEGQLAAEVELGRSLVAVAIGDGRHQVDLVATQAHRIVRIAAVRMLQCQALVEGDLAAVQGQAEGHIPTAATDAALHAIGGLVEEDLLPAGDVHQPAVLAVGGGQAIGGAAGAVGAVAAIEQRGDVRRGVGVEVAFIDGEIEVLAAGVDARAIVEEGQFAAQIERGFVVVAVVVGDGGDQLDLAAVQAERVVRVVPVRMHESARLFEDQPAAVERDAEGNRSG